MSQPVKVVVEPELCTACRACELACHYHHNGRFGTSRASVRLRYDADTSELAITFDDTCDQCAGEAEPLCAHFCVAGAIRIRP